MIFKKIISCVLILLIAVPFSASALLAPIPFVPTDTIPPVPTSDAALRDKDVGVTVFGYTVPGVSFDSIAIAIAKIFIEKMVDSTVAWINNGFNGNPAFISDPANYFTNIADGIAGDFIYGSDVGFLCSPYQTSLRLSLAINYSKSTGRYNRTPQCTLSGVIDNVEDFYNDFSNGGWDSWFQITQNPAYNPYTGYIDAQNDLTRRIATAVGAENQKLDWGNGFLSRKGDCIDFGDLGNGTDGCREYAPDKTPGTVIEKQLEGVLGTGVRQLELADEFDELIGALLGQLLQKTVFGGKGLVTSSPYKTSGGSEVVGGGTISQPPTTPDNPWGPTTPPEQPPTITPGSFSCSPNPMSISTGGTITWSVADGTGYPSVFTWNGEGVDGKTGVSVTATYATPGNKTVSVTAVPTDGVTPPETVTCSIATVTAPTLNVSCAPTSTFVTNVGEAVGWTATISGGSGSYSNIKWGGDESALADGSDAWSAYTPQIIRSGNTVTVNQLRVYYETGLKFANISVVDNDTNVNPVVEKLCSAGIQVN